jgi:gamma-glutamylcysteine synthetase
LTSDILDIISEKKLRFVGSSGSSNTAFMSIYEVNYVHYMKMTAFLTSLNVPGVEMIGKDLICTPDEATNTNFITIGLTK